MEYDNQYILDKIKSEKSLGSNPIAKRPKLKMPWEGYIDNTSYDVPASAVYDFDREGKGELKFENYLGATGNEDRLARQQSAGEQIANGLWKNLQKTGLYALDGINTFTYGLYSAINEGRWQALWDNDVSNYLDDASKRLDRQFANYYTDEEKSKGFLGRLWENPANFLANDLAGGLAFVGGAVLPELALGVLTGGASAPASFAKLSAKMGLKTAFKSADNIAGAVAREGVEQTVRNTAKQVTRQQAKDGISALMRSSTGKRVGEVANFARFVGQSTFFEAGMEARHNFHDSIDKYMQDFQEREGRLPSQEELTAYIGDASKSADFVFFSNVGLLSLTNASMFGKMFKLPSLNLETKIGKAFGIDVTKLPTGKLAIQNATKAQKVAGNVYFLGRKPFMEGVVEEGMQGVFGKTMDNYLEAKYDPSQTDVSVLSSFGEALKDQYTSKEGWFEIGIGAIIGMIGGNVSGDFGIEGLGKKGYSGARKNLEGNIEIYNEGTAKAMKNLIRTNSVANYNAGKETGVQSAPAFQDTVVSYNYIKANEALKGYVNTVEDFNTAVDAIVFTPDQMKEFGFRTEADLNGYKASLKENFAKDYEIYQEAETIVNNLQVPVSTQGELAEFRDAVTFSLMAGKKAGVEAERIAQNIAQITGINGIYDAMKFSQEMSEKQINDIQTLQEKESRLEELKKEILDVGQRIQDSKDNEALYKENTKKHLLLSQEILKLTDETQQLKEVLDNDFKVIQANVTFTPQEMSTLSIDTLVDKMSNLEGYINALQKTGRTSEAKNLKTLLEQFNLYTSAEVNAIDTIRRMSDTNFYASKEGKSFLGKLRGEKYKMSDSARKEIEENSELFRELLVKNGFEYGNVSEVIEKLIEAKEDLSEREKYKMESMLRATLAYRRIQESVESAQNEVKNAEETVVEDFTQEGDTITIAKKLQGTDLNNPESINQLIKDITGELDAIVNKPTAEALREIKAKQKQIEQLRQRIIDLQNATTKQSTESLPMGNESETSGEVREGNTQGQETTQEGNQEEIEAKKADIERRRQEEILNRKGNTISQSEVQKRFIEKRNSDKVQEKLTEGLNHTNGNINPEKRWIDKYDTIFDELTSLGVKPDSRGIIDGTAINKAFTENESRLKKEVNEEIKQEGLKRVTDEFRKQDDLQKFKEINAKYDAELKALEEQTTPKQQETISDEDYTNFIDNGVVSNEIIDLIANKVKDNLPLTERESAIFTDKTSEVNQRIIEINTESEFGSPEMAEKIKEQIDSLTQEEIDEVINEVEQEDDFEAKKADIERRRQEEILKYLDTTFGSETISLEEERKEQQKINAKYDAELEQLNTQQNDTTRKNGTDIGGETITNTDGANREDVQQETVETTQPVDATSDIEKQVQEITQSIQKLEDEIKDLETPFKFMDSEGYIRYNKLLQKKIDQGSLSPQEEQELTDLEGSINQWITISGVRVQGIELSDLIKQLQALENTVVEQDGGTREAEEEEVDEDARQSEDAVRNNYDVGLSYNGVVSRRTKDSVVVSNISLETLEEASGVELKGRDGVTIGETGGVQLSNEIVKEINEKGNIVILNPAFDEVSSYYSLVLQSIPNPVTGVLELYPIQSDYDIEDGEVYQEGVISSETVYNAVKRDIVLLKIDPRHPYNKQLLEELRNEMGISKPLTEEELRKEVDEIVQQKASKSATIKKVQSEIVQLQTEQDREKLTTTKQARLKTLEQRLKDSLKELRVEAEQKVLERKEKKPKKPSAEMIEKIIKKLRIMAVNEDGENLQILKGIREGEGFEGTNPHFEALRIKLASDPQALLDLIESNNFDTYDLGVTVSKIFMGLPNYNYVRNADGSTVRQHKPIVKEDLSKIEDIGYVSEGKLHLRSGKTDNVNMDFIKSPLNKKSKDKHPVIVIKKGNHLIAFPVRVGRDESPIDLNTFKSIYESDSITAVVKAIRLNTMLAQAGIDVKQKGNAFVVIGDNALNDEFFNNIFAQLTEKEYIRSVDSWTDPKTSIESSLLDNATTSIRLSDPFISPKIKFDFSAIEAVEIPQTKKKSTKKAVVDNKQSLLKNYRCK